MRKPPDERAIWRRWEAEAITLDELLRQLQACGWQRRYIYERLEREADREASRQRLGSHAKLINY